MNEIIIARTAIEILSAIICLILLKFMIKPYSTTHESRYIGLPLGFGFLGASYAVSAIAYIERDYLESAIGATMWIQLLFRGFAFLFLSVTYYFSKKPTKNSRYLWNIIFSGLFVSLSALALLFFISPQIPMNNYLTINTFIRILSISCIAYIAIHCLREYKKDPDPIALKVLYGFAILGLSQLIYSIIFFYNSGTYANEAFFLSISLRLISLSIFLFASYQTFYQFKKGSGK